MDGDGLVGQAIRHVRSASNLGGPGNPHSRNFVKGKENVYQTTDKDQTKSTEEIAYGS